jgi:hypothetical protein
MRYIILLLALVLSGCVVDPNLVTTDLTLGGSVSVSSSGNYHHLHDGNHRFPRGHPCFVWASALCNHYRYNVLGEPYHHHH